MNHDDVVARATKVARAVGREAVIRAFVGSLSTRNLPARSAFGSYIVVQKLKAHSYRRSPVFTGEHNCAYCGLPPETEYEESDDRVGKYPFQVRHTDVQYATFDLETFGDRPVDEPSHPDIECLIGILDAIRALHPGAALTELVKSFSGVIKSNKHERQILLETFGYAGILCPIGKHHYSTKFVTHEESNSDQPKEFYKREWEYPVRFWTGNDGVNEKMVNFLFGKFI